MSTQNEPLKIEVGKFYRTRDGAKVRIYSLDGLPAYPVHGAILNADGWACTSWTGQGKIWEHANDKDSDLISEWIDAPEVDWSAMPAWAQFVAMDREGNWFHYSNKPAMESDWYGCNDRTIGEIPDVYCPKFSGDWKQSLCERPKA